MSASIAVTVTKFKIAELWTNAQLVTRKYSPRHFNENQCTRSFLFPRMPEVFNRIKLSAIVTREYTHTHRLANKLTNTQNNTDIHLHIPENCVKMYRRRHAGTQAWLIQHARRRTSTQDARDAVLQRSAVHDVVWTQFYHRSPWFCCPVSQPRRMLPDAVNYVLLAEDFWIFLATTCQTMVDVRSVLPFLTSGTHFLSISGNQHQELSSSAH